MIVLIIILISYCFLLLILLFGWRKQFKKNITGRGIDKSGITIVIACKDERENIDALVTSLKLLQYPSGRFEIIFVDDHSSDDTYDVIQNQIREIKNYSVMKSPEGSMGKKSAINLGITHAKYNIIATTDADCLVPSDWLSYLSLYFEDSSCKMVMGGVRLNGCSAFDRLQALEFASLIGSTAATAALGHPIMSNGANLAFRKEVFSEVSGYSGNLHIASGDDEFLMRKIHAKYHGGVRFIPFSEDVVTSKPQYTLREFISQRLRWAAKWRHNSDVLARMTAVLVLMAQLGFLILLTYGMISDRHILIFPLVKILLELTFLLQVTKFLRIKFNPIAFLILQVVYPIYVMVIGLLSLSGSYRWKGRNYND